MTAGAFALIISGLLVLAASSALFSSIETALFSLQPYHVERLKKRRASLGHAVSRLLENPRRIPWSIFR
jgi:Mg2+/Co2+ transporter CorB